MKPPVLNKYISNVIYKANTIEFLCLCLHIELCPSTVLVVPLTQMLGADCCSCAINMILYEFDIIHAVSLRCIGTTLSSLYFHYCTVKCILVPIQVIYVLKLDAIFLKSKVSYWGGVGGRTRWNIFSFHLQTLFLESRDLSNTIKVISTCSVIIV